VTGVTGMKIIRAIVNGNAIPRCWHRCATCAARPAWRPCARPWWVTTSRSTSLRSPSAGALRLLPSPCRRVRCADPSRARCAHCGEGKSECSIAEGAASSRSSPTP
jgi:hypothetical protein